MADLMIGKLGFNAEVGWSDPAYRQMRKQSPGLLGLQERFVYHWDCALEPGGNPPWPEHHVIEPLLSFGLPEGPQPLPLPRALARAGAITKRVGVTTSQELDAALLATLPPMLVRIPWLNLSANFNAEQRVQVIAFNAYTPLVLRPATQPAAPPVVLHLPAWAEFWAIVAGHCVEVPPGSSFFPDKAPAEAMPPKDADAHAFVFRARAIEETWRKSEPAAEGILNETRTAEEDRKKAAADRQGEGG